MYSKYAGLVDIKSSSSKVVDLKYQPKQYHHVKVDWEFKKDCKVWLSFISDPDLASVVNRPMIGIRGQIDAEQLLFYSDASAAKNLGYGCIFNKNWIFGQWEPGFVQNCKPSIKYLELYALCAGILTWESHPLLCNRRVIVFCDNQAVVAMINNISSSCANCMHLIRILVLNGLIHNRRIFAHYVHTKSNGLADALSRLDMCRFRKLGPHMNQFPDKTSEKIWPVSNIWQGFSKKMCST